MQAEFASQTRKAKYQLNKNVFVSCYLDILEANAQAVRALVGVQQRFDTKVAVGTRIYFNAESTNQGQGDFHSFSVTVLKTEDDQGKQVHICTPISHEVQQNRREAERKPVNFPVLLVDSQTIFSAVNGTATSLSLTYTAQKAMLKLTVNRPYGFKVNYKGEDCHLEGVIKHIHYDWRTFQHRVGVHFPKLQKDEQIILNLMVDPDYTVPISTKQTVDTSQGKISLND